MIKSKKKKKRKGKDSKFFVFKRFLNFPILIIQVKFSRASKPGVLQKFAGTLSLIWIPLQHFSHELQEQDFIFSFKVFL